MCDAFEGQKLSQFCPFAHFLAGEAIAIKELLHLTLISVVLYMQTHCIVCECCRIAVWTSSESPMPHSQQFLACYRVGGVGSVGGACTPCSGDAIKLHASSDSVQVWHPT